MTDLPESQLYSFLDNEHQFTLHFLEGQKLIHDLAIIHNMKGKGFAYFRDSILTAEPLISFLKPGEGFGLFLDNINPKFSLKIETNSAGLVRCLILPESFDEFPLTLKGECRLSKIFPGKSMPYTSIVPMEDISFKDVVNNILRDSYQVQSEVVISKDSDQSIMYTQLPNFNVDRVEDRDHDLSSYKKLRHQQIDDFFRQGETEEAAIISFFSDLGLDYLGRKRVMFKCSCARERIIQNLQSLAVMDKESLFRDGEDSIEIKCDYCNTYYQIKKDEI
jgi:molecular chaperone Hsp33